MTFMRKIIKVRTNTKIKKARAKKGEDNHSLTNNLNLRFIEYPEFVQICDMLKIQPQIDGGPVRFLANIVTY